MEHHGWEFVLFCLFHFLEATLWPSVAVFFIYASGNEIKAFMRKVGDRLRSFRIGPGGLSGTFDKSVSNLAEEKKSMYLVDVQPLQTADFEGAGSVDSWPKPRTGTKNPKTK